MQEELLALEAQNQSLQSLVGELLVTNQRLREQLMHFIRTDRSASGQLTEQATHPLPHPGR